MKFVSIFIAFSFFLLASVNVGYAQNTFRCEWQGDVLTGNCVTADNTCSPGSEAVFNDGTRCEDVTLEITCRTYSNSSGQCRSATTGTCEPNSVICDPDGVTLKTCTNNGDGYIPFNCGTLNQVCRHPQGENTPRCISSCIPGSISCSSDGRLVYECSSNGYTKTIKQGCAENQICNATEQRCVSTGNSGGSGGSGGNGGSGGSGGSGSSGNDGSIVDIRAVINAIPQIENPLLDLNADTSLGQIISILLPFLLTLAGIGLLLFLIFGGFQYLTSAGDPKKTEAAKGTLTAAIIGFVLIITAFLITQIVSAVFKLGGGF